MPRYEPRRIEAKWQRHWEEHSTFQTSDTPPAGSSGKLYVLDMFPYPSGSGLHVGHPEGYTATDIVCRYSRMRGKHVLHPMGWDAFGLPAEQHAIRTGTHPRTTTYKNIDTFRRQLKMLGFSYDWSRELSTTDEPYFRWTQWIFLELFDSWYDAAFQWTGSDGKSRTGQGRPIAELPIPAEVRAAGGEAVRRYQDKRRLAYISHAPVNWCPALGTVLANEEVIDGKSERGGHPVVRLPLRQWMLRITAYADRLLSELDDVEWPESIKALQRNWIGRSTGAEVDFFVEMSDVSGQTSEDGGRRSEVGGRSNVDDQPSTFAEWKNARAKTGYPADPEANVLRIYTTRPDTLFGATYMVVAPEHPSVERITTAEQRAAVEAYRAQASRKSDLDRTDLAKEKTGVFTGAHAINPVNGERIPIWIADYVLISYGTGAIMAVPAHDQRDFEFAVRMNEVGEGPRIAIRRIFVASQRYSTNFVKWCDRLFGSKHVHCVYHVASNDPAERQGLCDFIEASPYAQSIAVFDAEPETGVYVQVGTHVPFNWPLGEYGGNPVLYAHRADDSAGTAINSGSYDGLLTMTVKDRLVKDLARQGLGREAVNYRLRDWLFSRQHYWGEPFPIWHELDADGQPTGLMRAEPTGELPVRLPDDFEFKPHGRPEPPLEEAADAWLYKTADDGTRLKRETNSMPQWAGSCWYFLRFCDPKNDQRFIDPDVEKYWMPVDLYIGGAEHAVLHLLYARFWHKLLFDRGHVSTCEPFRRLVNQGMILGEATYLLYYKPETLQAVSADQPLAIALKGGSQFRLASASNEMITIEGNVFTRETSQFGPPSGASNEPQKSLQPSPVKEQTGISSELEPPTLTIETILANTPQDVHVPYAKDSETVSQLAIAEVHVMPKGGGKYVLKTRPHIAVRYFAEKMSKSRGNVVNPDDVVAAYGADALRMFEMFMGPLEQVKPWSMSGVEGVYRFLGRVWRLLVDDRADEVTLNAAVQDVAPTDEQVRLLHKTIKAVTDDIEKLSFNTAISRMMEFTNELTSCEVRPRAVLEPFVLLLSPFAPHVAEELWELMGHSGTLAYEPWPEYDEAKLVADEIELPVQISGKVRARIKAPTGADQAAIERLALADDAVQQHLAGKSIVKIVIVPGRMVNIVTAK